MASRFTAWTLVAPLTFGLVVACYGGTDLAADGAGTGPGAATAAASPPESTTVKGSDLSCEMGQFLAERCQSCHGKKPTSGAIVSLLGYADLVKPLPGDAKKKVYDEVLARIKDAEDPMPPADAKEGPVTAPELALVENWVKAGAPKESCGAGAPPPPPPANDPYATATVCSSNKLWKQADKGSAEMHPGKACIACHQKNIKTLFKASFDMAGTVYPTGHEPDDCYGVAGGTKVVITGADGQVFELPVNAAGNFSHATPLGLSGKIALPYKAKVVRGGKESVMKDAQTNGDCNACHTEQGTSVGGGAKKAPGRIMAP